MNENIHLHIPNIINYDVNYYFSESADEHPARIWPFHLHDQMELYILLEGDVSFVVESSLYKLSPGDAIVTKPNEMHNCILNTASVHRHLCFWFDPSCAFIFQDFLSHDFGKNNLIVADNRAKLRLLEVYKELKLANDESDSLKQFYLTLQMLSIFRRFLLTDSPTQEMPNILKEILSDIDKNFKIIHSLNYFTAKYYISSSTLNRLFRSNLHTSPKLYLETKKLAHSRFLLKNGESPLSACMESGFNDYSSYVRLFKKRFSITPKQYRDGK